MFGKRQQDGLFDAPFLWRWVFAAAIIAEVRPPRAADESSLASEEFAIDVTAFSDDLAFPFPQRPVPAAVVKHHITAVFVNHVFGGKATDATV